MKPIFFFAAIFLPSIFFRLNAQVPYQFNYQGIARDAEGQPLNNQTIGIQISILSSPDSSNFSYVERHQVQTNSFGLYTLQIGKGKVLQGSMQTVPWEQGNQFIRVAIDPQGGTRFQDVGTTQLLSVPYALYAERAGESKTASGIRAGNQHYLSKFDASGSSSAEINSQVFDNGTNIGIGTTSPSAKLHVNQNVAAVQEHVRMQNTNANGAGRFTLYSDGSTNYSTFTKYGSTYPGGYAGVPTLYPFANLLAFGNNGVTVGDGMGRFLISSGGNIGISLFKSGVSKLKFHADFSSENVGIGGASVPVARVHLNNTDGANMDMMLSNNTTGHTATDGFTIVQTGNEINLNQKEAAALRFSTSNTEQLRIASNGNIGIGTNAPSAKLDVNGQLRIQGGNPGVGKVLVSDANGLASWQTPASGSSGTLNQSYNSGGPGLGRIITADSGAVLIQGEDGLQVTGNFGFGELLSLSGPGSRMFYYPRKGAFRSGTINNTNWDEDSIGIYSTSAGYDTKATGAAATSFGIATNAIGQGSVALGAYTEARGSDGATAIGNGTIAQSYSSLALGMYNDPISTSNSTASVLTDPLVTIGNGSNSLSRSNALTLLKNGNLGLGTNNPSEKLEVNGQVRITGGTPGAGKVLTSDANGTASWQFIPSTLFGATTLDSAYDYGGPGLGRIINATNGALYVNGPDGLHVADSVGIGTSNPLALLDVNGQIRIAGGTPGVGKVLTSDANGLATWQTGGAGANGKSVLNGTSNPSSGTGTDGDFYINTTTNQIFGPKTAGAWGSGVSLIGPAGAAGATGPQGAAGATGPQGPAGLLSAGSAAGNTPYWNGSAWVVNSSNIHNNGGNIGIGTTTPVSKLEVSGETKLRSTTTSGPMLLVSNLTTPPSTNVQTGVYTDINSTSSKFGFSANLAGNSSIGISTGFNSRFETTGGQNLFGIYNTFASTSGSGALVGLRNWVLDVSGYTTTTMTGIQNDFNQNTTNNSVIGVENNFTGTGGGIRYGIQNNYSGSGSTFYGVYNWIDNGSSTQYGNYSNFSSTGTGTKYGNYVYINPSAGGTHYGLYMDVTKVGGYAAYFKGRVSIGSTAANQYILPESRGTLNQIMQTDASGNVSWVNPSAAFSESDPKVGSLTNNMIPKWGTTSLQNGSIYDNGKVGIGTATPTARFQVADSAVVFNTSGDTSSLTYNNPPPVQGMGRRLLWYPERAAFRVGCVEYTDSVVWNRDSIGAYSMGLGYNTKAKGNSSVAFGWQTQATGNYAISSGYTCIASGQSSIAMGYGNNATGEASAALGVYNTASGYRSAALCGQNTASGSYSFAIGMSTIASGMNATAMTSLSVASGDYSIAGGYNSKSKGSISSAFGNNSQSNGYSSFVVGQYNDTLVSAQTSMNANTPLFIIGNGTSNTVRTNVLVARNNGRVGIGVNAPGGQFELGLDEGRKPGTNTWTIVSDARLKQIHGGYEKGLTEILQLQPIRYHYRNTASRQFPEAVLNQEQIGFSAQDVQNIFPECVQTDEDGYLSLNTHAILIAYVNAVKELHATQEAQAEKDKAHEQEIKQLQTEFKSLLERLEALEKK